ncbi:MAG: efflux transporter outer membrane subunit [Hymenobacter sp.]|nr:efflux transporter outer membrane subunit [Hymenobacter sp.]
MKVVVGRVPIVLRLAAGSELPAVRGGGRAGVRWLRIGLYLLLLTGCVRTPPYQAPDVAAPAQWKNLPDSARAAMVAIPASAPSTETQKPALGAWWALFNDPDLTALEQQAVGGNYSLQAAVARVEAARANVRVAASYRQPTVALVPQTYRTRLSALRPLPFAVATDGRSLGAVQSQYYVPLTVSYEVDVWGRLRGGIRAANADAQAAEAEAETVRLTLTADAADYYYSIRGLDAELAVLDTARRDREYSLKLAQARYKAGVDNEIASRRAETELASLEASLIEAQRQRAGLVAALATVVGVPASSFDVSSRPSALTSPPVPAAVPATLLGRRPDLRQAERQIAAANARADVARLTRLPTVSLNGFVGPQSAQLSKLGNVSDSYTYYVGGGVNIPVFNGGRNRANQQVAESQYNAATAQYRQAALVAFQEVETALANVRQTAVQIMAQQRALRAARQASLLTKERYRRGLTDYFQVVDADRQTLDAARLLVQAQGNQLSYTVQLIRALGGGWE